LRQSTLEVKAKALGAPIQDNPEYRKTLGAVAPIQLLIFNHRFDKNGGVNSLPAMVSGYNGYGVPILFN